MGDDRGSEIDQLLASLRADAGDAHAFLQALAVRLEGALPGQVQIERRGALFSRKKAVKQIDLDLGEQRYCIAEEGHGRLRAQRVHVVRGIALKTEDLSVEEWIQGLAGHLTSLAETSSRAREALERLLIGR